MNTQNGADTRQVPPHVAAAVERAGCDYCECYKPCAAKQAETDALSVGTFVLQARQPNPFQHKEALTQNRTFHAYRWKDVAVIHNATLRQATAEFSGLLDTGDYRIEER